MYRSFTALLALYDAHHPPHGTGARAGRMAFVIARLTLHAPRLLASLPKGRDAVRRAVKTALRLRHFEPVPRLDPRALAAWDGQARPPAETGGGVTVQLIERLTAPGQTADIAQVPVFVAHAMGGGAELYLQHRLKNAGHHHYVILRLGGAERCRIEVVTQEGRITAGTDDLDLVVRLVTGLKRRRIVYSCAVGDPDPVTIPGFLRALAGEAPLEMLFHDYLALSPSFHLLDADGVFRGVPVPVPGRASQAHTARRPDGTLVTLADWRASWHAALARADRLIVFSHDSRAHVSAAYPDLAARIEIAPHSPLADIPRIARAQTDRLVIGIAGNLNEAKGAKVAEALSHRLGRDLVVLGRTDPACRLHRAARIHGGYSLADLPDLTRHYGITTWLVPSICPETFSYTTQECLMTGLPVITFDLGAQGEAVRSAAKGIALPIPAQGPASDAAVDAILRAARDAPPPPG